MAIAIAPACASLQPPVVGCGQPVHEGLDLGVAQRAAVALGGG
jgi:hypothetical protein